MARYTSEKAFHALANLPHLRAEIEKISFEIVNIGKGKKINSSPWAPWERKLALIVDICNAFNSLCLRHKYVLYEYYVLDRSEIIIAGGWGRSQQRIAQILADAQQNFMVYLNQNC